MFALAGCGQPSDQPSQPARPIPRASDKLALSNNPSQAKQEIHYRVQRSLRVVNGLVVLRDPETHTTIVFPTDTNWVVSCNDFVGLWIDFGASVEGGPDGVGNAASLQIAVDIPQGQCSWLGPMLGEEILLSMSSPKREDRQ